jgi:hypothetical protein
MFEGESGAAENAKKIVDELGSHTLTKNHARHIHIDRLKELGVKVKQLEEDQKLQDAVLAVHHACIHSLTHTPALKIIENQNNISFIIAAQFMAAPAQPQHQLPPQP